MPISIVKLLPKREKEMQNKRKTVKMIYDYVLWNIMAKFYTMVYPKVKKNTFQWQQDKIMRQKTPKKGQVV